MIIPVCGVLDYGYPLIIDDAGIIAPMEEGEVMESLCLTAAVAYEDMPLMVAALTMARTFHAVEMERERLRHNPQKGA